MFVYVLQIKASWGLIKDKESFFEHVICITASAEMVLCIYSVAKFIFRLLKISLILASF